MSRQDSKQIENVKVMLLKGENGSSIESIEKTGTSGLVDTYTITLTDGSKQTFNVSNGKEITDVQKTGTQGLVDTYTITFNDDSTETFTVTNGNGITSIEKTGTNVLVDTYTITMNNGSTATFTVTNGKGITKIEKTFTIGLVDIYTITYNDGTTSEFNVTNGNAENLQDAIKATTCSIRAGVSSVTFSQLGNAHITYIPNSECVENALVIVGFDNGSMYKGTMNYSSALGKWGLSNVELIQGSDVPSTWDVGYGNDSVGTRAFRTGTDFAYSNGIGIALSTSSDVVSYYCVLSSGRVSNNYLQTLINQINSDLSNKITIERVGYDIPNVAPSSTAYWDMGIVPSNVFFVPLGGSITGIPIPAVAITDNRYYRVTNPFGTTQNIPCSALKITIN